MKRIVKINGHSMDSIEEHVLKECLNIMFPGGKIEIRSGALLSSPDEEIIISSVLAQKG